MKNLTIKIAVIAGAMLVVPAFSAKADIASTQYVQGAINSLDQVARGGTLPYSRLTDAPDPSTIAQDEVDNLRQELHKVAFSGNYPELENLPNIGAMIEQYVTQNYNTIIEQAIEDRLEIFKGWLRTEVMNGMVVPALAGKQDTIPAGTGVLIPTNTAGTTSTLQVDTFTPIPASPNLITSGAVFTAGANAVLAAQAYADGEISRLEGEIEGLMPRPAGCNAGGCALTKNAAGNFEWQIIAQTYGG
ncbi:MAG: hypothetical protein LBB23_02810 [Rickettsiales bacterium]|jgi:hypothetical protein|nr:hypothetical protein [Rickettsiales bacterium]